LPPWSATARPHEAIIAAPWLASRRICAGETRPFSSGTRRAGEMDRLPFGGVVTRENFRLEAFTGLNIVP
jgi:hypothetical protein